MNADLLNIMVHLSYHTCHLEGQEPPSVDPHLNLSDLIKFQQAHHYCWKQQVNHQTHQVSLVVSLRELTGWTLTQARQFLLAYLEVHDTRFHYLRRTISTTLYHYVVDEPRIRAPWPITPHINEAVMMTRGEARRLLSIMTASGYGSGYQIVDWECAHLSDPPIRMAC